MSAFTRLMVLVVVSLLPFSVVAQEMLTLKQRDKLVVYTGMLKNHGYVVNPWIINSRGHVELKFSKLKKSEEAHGILKLPWQRKEIWNLKLLVGPEQLRVIDSESKVEQKAPVLGKWRAIKETAKLPTGLEPDEYFKGA